MAFRIGRMNWTCGLACIRGSTIYEYDMEAAGLSVLRDRDLISPKEHARLQALPKSRRVVEVGLLCRGDDVALQAVESGTREAVAEFCQENGFDEGDIISVKRDAVYSLRPARVLRLGEYIRFREDGRYTSFFNLSGVEFYYSCRNRSAVVKGIGREVERTHRDHFIKLICGIIDLSENLKHDRLMQILALKRRDYVTMKAGAECYREMSANNAFRLKGSLTGVDLYADHWPGPDSVDISYNYAKFIVPLVAALV